MNVKEFRDFLNHLPEYYDCLSVKMVCPHDGKIEDTYIVERDEGLIMLQEPVVVNIQVACSS